MLYSSGTTGRPKGILRPLPEVSPAEAFALRQQANRYGFGPDTVYLSPAPLYHAAPLAYVVTVQSFGGKAVMMARFDADRSLELIPDYRLTHSPWVPAIAVPCPNSPDTARRAFAAPRLPVAIHPHAPRRVA